MSQAPTGPGGTTSSPAEPGGTPAPAPLASGATSHPAAGGRAAGPARYAPAAAAAAVMVVLGIWGLARDSAMGNDEVATRWAALLSLRDLAHLVDNVDAVHGFYYLLMHGWAAVGSSPEVLRIPSLAAMAVAAALVAIMAGRLTGSGWAGLFAGLVMALTPVISYYAQTARSYAMVCACVAGATLVLVHALQAEAAGASGRRIARWWVAYGTLVTIGGYLNELALLMLAAHAITVLLARSGRPAVRHWAAAAAVGAVLVTPLLLVSLREDSAVNWISRPGLAALRILFHDYFGATTAVALLLAACAIVAVLPARGAGAAAPWWRSGGVTLPSVGVPLLVVPALLLIAESLVARPLYVDRYVLYGEAGAALLAGAGMWRIGRWLAGRTGRRELLWAPGVVVCACVLLLQLGPQHRIRLPESRLYNFGGPSAYLGAHARPGDGVLFFTDFFRKARLGYPGDFTKTSDFAMAVSPQQAGTFRGRDKSFAATLPLMLAHQRIWVLGQDPSLRLPPGQLRDESLVLRQHFHRAARRYFRGIVVTLWVRR